MVETKKSAQKKKSKESAKKRAATKAKRTKNNDKKRKSAKKVAPSAKKTKSAIKPKKKGDKSSTTKSKTLKKSKTLQKKISTTNKSKDKKSKDKSRKKSTGNGKKRAKKSETAKKSGIRKKGAARITLKLYDMQDVPEERHFYFVNGERVKNVKELAEIMDRIEQEVFDYHVNEEKNDFYNWVRHVFDDIELAEKLVGVTGPKHLQFTIYKHVADKALKKR